MHCRFNFQLPSWAAEGSKDFLEHILSQPYSSLFASSFHCSSGSALEFTAPPGLIKPKLADVKAQSLICLLRLGIPQDSETNLFRKLHSAALISTLSQFWEGAECEMNSGSHTWDHFTQQCWRTAQLHFHFSCLSEVFTSTGLLLISKTHLRLYFSPNGIACPDFCQMCQPVPHLPCPSAFSHQAKKFHVHSYL